jgi:hypothetical protein
MSKDALTEAFPLTLKDAWSSLNLTMLWRTENEGMDFAAHNVTPPPLSPFPPTSPASRKLITQFHTLIVQLLYICKKGSGDGQVAFCLSKSAGLDIIILTFLEIER